MRARVVHFTRGADDFGRRADVHDVFYTSVQQRDEQAGFVAEVAGQVV